MTRFLAVLLFTLCSAANAQSWPSKPVRVIVNVAPGGVADVTARVLRARLTETLGQPFVVENRAGGDGYIGFEAVRSAEPDGHTLGYSPGSSVMIAPHIGKRRIVAVAGPVRDQDLPCVPTLEEKGSQCVDGGPHCGRYTPGGTSREMGETRNR